MRNTAISAEAFLTGSIDETTEFTGSDNLQQPAAVCAGGAPREPAAGHLFGGRRTPKGCNVGADRAGLVTCAEAVGRPDTGHHETEPPGGEHWRSRL